MSRCFRLITPLVALLAVGSAALLTFQPVQAATAALPPTLAGTGWPAARALPYTPQYPLWSDGADKQRWILLPPGRSIDASNPDAFVFPRGTRLWKQFSWGGRPVETRYMVRGQDGGWAYASYRWNEAGTEATLVPPSGLRGVPVPQAPGGQLDLPSRSDCLACHDSAASPVLGLNALQLAPDLPGLAQRGLLRHLPPTLLQTPPRIPAVSEVERAALGYLHGNCGHCHNASPAAVPLTLRLAQSAATPAAAREQVLKSSVGVPAHLRPAGTAEPWLRIAPGRPDKSLLLLRMRSRHAAFQMPPLGTTTTDDAGLARVERWITEVLQPAPLENTP